MKGIARDLNDRIADLLKTRSYHEKCVMGINEKIAALQNPEPKKPNITMRAVMAKAKESGMTPEEIAKKLKVKVD